MCGICGIVGFSDKNLIENMTQSLVHRGPDEKTFYFDSNCSFGFCRLSIIDLENGKQPLKNENDSIVAVINGEIYNYIDLRHQLELKGHNFNSNCDSEVIVHLYEEYGEELVARLNGMFAFAIWDGTRLILGRDRMGKKPLYYLQHKDVFIFASEIKSLIQFKQIKFSLNTEYLFPHSYFDLKENTFINEIKQVKPGHVLAFQDGKIINEVPYWQYPKEIKYKDEKQTAEALYALLKDSVKLRLQSDVPVGLLLSGGLDSNIILALASEYKKKIPTFTVGSPYNSEIDIARRSAECFNTDHHEFIFDVNDMQAVLPQVVWGVESCDPRTIDTSIPTYFVMRMAKEYVRVILCGEGADELFGRYQSFFSHLTNEEDIYNECLKHCQSLYNLNLRRVDGMSMYHSIEGRCPFMDYRVVDMAFQTSSSLKNKGIEKYILRKAFENKVRDEVLYRRKMNFNVGTGIIDEWQRYLKEKLTDENIKKMRINQVKSPKTKIWQAFEDDVFSNYMILLANLFNEMFINENQINSIEEFLS
jgi:asparagine synthase (glutamine-hydrolysing)